MSSPLRAVLDAVDAGARSRADLGARTGLRPDVIDAALDHLVRMGRLEPSSLGGGCPPAGCGSCGSGVGGEPGCGTPSRPVLVQLTRRRP
ncbi:FeoC-like transcriptional regulator [Pseudonocardia sp. RS11V-5]|uniref:FeoC-like transcriptional regulator n=1 Tax=Pseudonocardia terrae TaxID=2905831 RepID=UPI001E4C75FE|nr:FeoC-like transcriptional regulator [Pseudonocardia terrae]MCE3550305.1 FeoC-like transcriptional regulator [Pseudonocardia terrae]